MSKVLTTMELLSTYSYLVEFTVLIAVIAFLYQLYSPFNYWKKLGVPYRKRQYPIIGTVDFAVSPMQKVAQNWFTIFPNEKFYGTFQLWRPLLMVRDPELAEQMMIKEFSHATNRNSVLDPDTNYLTKHLVNYHGEKWRNMRFKLIPTFTSGKLKYMYPQIVKCADSLANYLSKNQGEVQVKDICGRYSMDVIASIAFGLNLDVMNNPDSEFFKIGKTVFAPTLITRIFFMLQPFLAPVYKFFGISLVPKYMERFFINAVRETLEYREKNNVSRNDYLHLLSELKKKDEDLAENKEISSEDVFDEKCVISNAFIFFAAGFETTGSVISYTFYELAINPEVQEKLYQEIVAVLNKHNGEPTFEALNEMRYADQVLNEAMRKHPPAVGTERVITKEYKIPGTDVVLPVGLPVIFSSYGFHTSSQYFPEPEKFRPERFDPDNNEVDKRTFLPFGTGPRMCIAARFAKLEMKVCVVKVLKNFKVRPSPKTPIPMEYDPYSFMLSPKKAELWLQIEKRTTS